MNYYTLYLIKLLSNVKRTGIIILLYVGLLVNSMHYEMQVIDAICDYQKFNKKELAAIKNKKAKERGKFEKRIILDEA